MSEIAATIEIAASSRRHLHDSQALDEASWYALTVRHQHERRTAQTLSAQGWATLVPLYRTKRQWSDRVKEIDLPLFAGYVLCRFAAGDRMRIEDTPGVVTIVEFGGQPAPLRESEVEEIRRIASSPLPLLPWPYLKAGDAVRLERGPLKGLEGTLVRHRDQYRLVVGIELLQRSIAVEVSPEMITPLRALAVTR